MSKWKIKSIKHSGTCGKRGTERTEPYYAARNRCMVEFDYDDLKVGQPAILYYSPRKENYGNGICTSFVKSILPNSFDKTCILETENSIFKLECLEE